ncbi:MAG: alpha/beta fold hydrolase [Kiritimatiellia bacterium]|jgi:dipeptidyl aminopeptidase/acylaminoacyl peptidase|nr:alpha/beta fold hydrolase [Kiritimatiellia bacterium]
MKHLRILMGLALLLLAGFAALNILAYRHAYAMTHYTSGGPRTEKPEALTPLSKFRVLLSGVNLPRPVDERPPTTLAPHVHVLTIATPDGITLSAWYAKTNNHSPLVIFFHGYSTEKTRLLLEAQQIHAMGASVLLVDFRGSGGSSESYTTLGVLEAQDVAAAFRYAQENLPFSSLVLYGQSMGSAAILRAIHKYDIHPDGVILESIFDRMRSTLRNRFDAMGLPSFPAAELLAFWGGCQFGFSGFAHNPLDYANSLTCPALFLHGADDPRATLAEGQRVFEADPDPRKQMVVFENVGHNSYAAQHPDQWQLAVQTFLAPFLAPSPLKK